MTAPTPTTAQSATESPSGAPAAGEAVPAARRRPDTPAGPSLSPSRAADFKTCPLLFRFRTIDKLPETPSADQVRGTLVHAVLERLFDLPPAERTPEAAVALVAPEWERLLEQEPALAAVFADPAPGDGPLHRDPAALAAETDATTFPAGPPAHDPAAGTLTRNPATPAAVTTARSDDPAGTLAQDSTAVPVVTASQEPPAVAQEPPAAAHGALTDSQGALTTAQGALTASQGALTVTQGALIDIPGGAEAARIAAFLAGARNLLTGYFAVEDPQRLHPAERETLISTVIGDELLLRGYIDRLDVSPAGDLRVVDYKTGGAPREAFEGRALFQLKFYALVLWRTRGVVPRVLRLLYLKDAEICDYRPEASELERFERTLIALSDAIERAKRDRDFRPKPSRLCGWCSHQSRCPEFGGTPPPFPELTPASAATTAEAEPDRLTTLRRNDLVG